MMLNKPVAGSEFQFGHPLAKKFEGGIAWPMNAGVGSALNNPVKYTGLTTSFQGNMGRGSTQEGDVVSGPGAAGDYIDTNFAPNILSTQSFSFVGGFRSVDANGNVVRLMGSIADLTPPETADSAILLQLTATVIKELQLLIRGQDSANIPNITSTSRVNTGEIVWFVANRNVVSGNLEMWTNIDGWETPVADTTVGDFDLSTEPFPIFAINNRGAIQTEVDADIIFLSVLIGDVFAENGKPVNLPQDFYALFEDQVNLTIYGIPDFVKDIIGNGIVPFPR